ncbi:Eukaryotic translation initiation factor 4E-1A, partial [Xenotaenia resolanae]
LYNHIQLSSNLMSGCDYSLFKDGIEPMWEDERNKRGGRWLITLTKQQRRSDLDRYWLETVGLTVCFLSSQTKETINHFWTSSLEEYIHYLLAVIIRNR